MWQPVRPVHWALFDQGLVSGCNFLVSIMVARALTAPQLAHYSLAFITIFAIGTLHRALVTQPMNMLGVAEQPAQLWARYRALLWGQGYLLPLNLAVVLCSGWWFFRDAALIAAACLFTLAFLLQEIPRRFHYTDNQIHRAVRLDVLAYGGQVLVLAMCLLSDELTPARAFLVLSVAPLLSFGLGHWEITRHGHALASVAVKVAHADPGHTTRGVLAEHWAYANWVMAGLIVMLVSSQVFPFQLSSFATPQAVAAFVAANTIMNGLNVLRLTLGNYLPTQLSKLLADGGAAAMATYVRKVLLGCAVVSVVTLLGLWLLGDGLVDLLFAGKYPDAKGILLPLGAVNLLALLSLVGAVVLQVLRLSRGIFLANGVAALLVVAAGPWLIKSHGLVGAVMGAALGLVLPALLQGLYLRRKLRTLRPLVAQAV